MRLSGFTFIKNGLTLGYPIRESIQSIEPLCDEIVINVGFDRPDKTGDDGTYEYLRDHFRADKFRFLKSHWDPLLTKDGIVLSQQTDIALRECRGKYCQYIQGDEALHEDDLPLIERDIGRMDASEEIEGLVFHYLHFYGNVDVVRKSRSGYRYEVRLIRNFRGIGSWRDAQGFRKGTKKILAKKTAATVYHYGWARKEAVMGEKVRRMERLYHGDGAVVGQFGYRRIWGLAPFRGTHPRVMADWIEEHKNDLDIMSLPLQHRWGNVRLALSDLVERACGYRIGEYKNFIEVRR